MHRVDAATRRRAAPRPMIALSLVALHVLVGLVVFAPGHARGEQSGDLLVRATGFTHHNGRAMARLYRRGDDIRGEPYRIARADIRDGRAALRFPALPYGSYAVIVVHDENDNGKIDHNAFGIAAEPLGFSNGFVLGITSGMPSFEKLRFEFRAGGKPLEIRLSWK